MQTVCRWTIGLLLVAGLGATTRGKDNDKLPPPEEQPLQAILDRIHDHEVKGAWRELGWKDQEIEAWLNKVVKQCSAACERDLALPCKWADVTPSANADSLRNALWIADRLDTSFVQRSIVLVDGSARISSVRDSIVIVRGVATISSVDNSLIVAGHLLNVSSASSREGSPPSILLSRGYLDTSIVRNGILHAGEGVEGSICRDCCFVNCRPQRETARDNNKVATARDFTLGSPPLSALAGQIEPLASTSPPGAVFRFQGRRLFAEVNTPIVDESGQPVAGLDGWKLTFADSRATVFSKEGQDAVFHRPRR
jgi:hypothetical protein